MPKSFADWIRYSGLQWQMEGIAHKLRHGGTWHRYEGELPGWAHCGTWLSQSLVIQTVGRGQRKASPWQAEGEYKLNSLCRSCFAREIPIISQVREWLVEEKS